MVDSVVSGVNLIEVPCKPQPMIMCVCSHTVLFVYMYMYVRILLRVAPKSIVSKHVVFTITMWRGSFEGGCLVFFIATLAL